MDLPLRARRRFLRQGLALASGWTMLRHAAIANALDSSGLGAAFRGVLHIGAAVSTQTLTRQIAPQLELLAREFTSITPENCMKWEALRAGDEWRWDAADQLVRFGTDHGMYLVGHNFVWHSQIPRSVFQHADGAPLDRTQLLRRMEEHIATLGGRYRGRVHAWDVVNEALDEGNGWRQSPWYRIIGADFMEHAFRFAHAADPDARLLYNDYNMHNPQKRAFLLGVLRDYLDRGVPIHGIGLQGHIGLDYPDLEEWEKSIAAYAALGLEVHVTELDIDVLPSRYTGADLQQRADSAGADPDPYRSGLPEAVAQALADRYERVFRLLLRYRPQVKRVTFWGLHDGLSWKNDFPVRGRTNHPLLFDRKLQPKLAYQRLLALAAGL